MSTTINGNSGGTAITTVSGVNTNPPPPPPLTPAQKLTAAGLTVADLKLLLGLT